MVGNEEEIVGKTWLNKQGRYCTYIGQYKVVQESKRFSGIYDGEHLITSGTSWRKAIKLAKLLNEAYEEGKESMRDRLF